MQRGRQEPLATPTQLEALALGLTPGQGSVSHGMLAAASGPAPLPMPRHQRWAGRHYRREQLWLGACQAAARYQLQPLLLQLRRLPLLAVRSPRQQHLPPPRRCRKAGRRLSRGSLGAPAETPTRHPLHHLPRQEARYQDAPLCACSVTAGQVVQQSHQGCLATAGWLCQLSACLRCWTLLAGMLQSQVVWRQY